MASRYRPTARSGLSVPRCLRSGVLYQEEECDLPEGYEFGYSVRYVQPTLSPPAKGPKVNTQLARRDFISKSTREGDTHGATQRLREYENILDDCKPGNGHFLDDIQNILDDADEEAEAKGGNDTESEDGDESEEECPPTADNIIEKIKSGEHSKKEQQSMVDSFKVYMKRIKVQLSNKYYDILYDCHEAKKSVKNKIQKQLRKIEETNEDRKYNKHLKERDNLPSLDLDNLGGIFKPLRRTSQGPTQRNSEKSQKANHKNTTKPRKFRESQEKYNKKLEVRQKLEQIQMDFFKVQNACGSSAVPVVKKKKNKKQQRPCLEDF